MKRVEYIQSSGTQFINTGIIPTTDSKIEITLSDVLSTSALSGERCIFGVGTYSSNTYLMTRDTAGQTPLVWYYRSKKTITTDLTSKHTIEFYRGSVTLDGTVIHTDETIGGTLFGVLCLFTAGANYNATYRSGYKLYNFKIYTNDVLVFNGSPALDDNNVACLYDEVSETFLYNSGTGDFVAGAPLVVCKYLIEDGGDYYSVLNGVLTNIGRTLNAQLFADYGMDDVPDYDDYDALPAPSILCWNDTNEVPMSAVVVGLPYPQVVYSQNIEMISSTITGIDSVEITSDDDTLFAMSFDDGSTWYNYVNNQWVLLTTSTAGQTKDSVEDIPTNAWNAKVTNRQLKFRFTLLDENGYVTQIKVNYTN